VDPPVEAMRKKPPPRIRPDNDVEDLLGTLEKARQCSGGNDVACSCRRRSRIGAPLARLGGWRWTRRRRKTPGEHESAELARVIGIDGEDAAAIQVVLVRMNRQSRDRACKRRVFDRRNEPLRKLSSLAKDEARPMDRRLGAC